MNVHIRTNRVAKSCYIHGLFEEQAKRTPDAVAVVFAGQSAETRDQRPEIRDQGSETNLQSPVPSPRSLRYCELNARANQLAHHLQTLGVGPEVLVGVCIERSLDMVVALLAILKAGGAYVPLDPTYPQERLAFMLHDANVAVLITQAHLQDHLPTTCAKQVCLARDWAQIASQPRNNPTSQMQPDQLAYVIYTSGSTGQPKGVMIEHSGVCHLAKAQQRAFGVQPRDRVLQFASLNFDASVWEIIMALCAGGTLYVAPADDLLPGPTLTHFLREHAITHVTLVPSALATLAPEELPTLQTVIVAGEACPAALAQRWQPGQRFFNAYGPTEATVCATLMPCPPQTVFTVAPPIGWPLAHVQVHILNEHLQPVARGEAGELYIGGAALARGYLNHPALTAARFIPNPWGAGRLYKTGDWARQLPDGAIDFLGRIDHQVKVRGFRIELGEIEAVLRQHPTVRDAVVTVKERDTADKRLVAYMTPKSAEFVHSPNQLVQAVRAHVQQQLPAYMLPAAFVVLEALPLTLNGKVDRKALPALDAAAWTTTEFAPPQTATETLLAAIWSEVLGLSQVGRTTHFFESGGHSLLANQVVTRLRTVLGVEISVRTLFETPVLAELAQVIDQQRPTTALVLPPPTAVGERPATLTLSYAQQRLWFLDQLERSNGKPSITYNVPCPLHLRGALDVAALHAALAAIIQRHEVLRTVFPVVNGVAQQRIAPTFSLPLPSVDLQTLPAPQAALQRQLGETTWQPFDLATGPLLRATLYRLHATEHVLALTFHHIIIDGWSLNVFLRELEHYYHAYSTGVAPTLTPLPLQYADFALWQRQWLQGARLEQQRSYWRQQLASAPPLLTLPTDYPRPPVQTFHGGMVEFTVEAELTTALQRLSQQQGVSLFMTLYAAFAALLARYSGQEDIVIGVTVANRQQRELELLIGFFVNTLPLRVNLTGNPSFTDLLARVRQLTLDAYAHQDIPFEQLVSEVLTQRSLSHAPLFQVMLTFANTNPTTQQMADLAIEPLMQESVVAKFDLTLQLTEHAGGLRAGLEYNRDLFARATIERMVGHFQSLLRAMVTNPAVALQQASLQSATERHQLLVEWNNTATAYPKAKTIAQLFEEQIAQTPDAVAVVLANTECGVQKAEWRLAPSNVATVLTYRKLNERANQLAHYLRTQGVGPETLVAICVERSWETIIGILGILKAGGAYVPLDPAYPQERLAFMLEDTAAPLVLTQAKLRARLPSTVTAMCLDTAWTTIASQPTSNPSANVTAENLAYVMYTSGSTGRPKGVCITQRNVVRLVQDTNFARLTADEVFLQLAPISFDAATLEIWGALLNGGRLVVMPPGQPSLEAIGDAIRHYGVTTLWLTAGLFHLMVDECIDALRPLRQLLAGGDVLSVPHVQRFLQAAPACQLINGYGPTENTTFTCCYPFRADGMLAASAPIGPPIANTQVYILDPQMQPAPISIPGELYAGGDGLARGYLNRPELTHERFIANPFGPGKLYKTGDLARWLPAGNIEFLGRIDQQVKIRGFRIELGEIETALAQHPQVQAAVVIARQDHAGEKQLVAYLVPRQEVNRNERGHESPVSAPQSPDLRDHLRQTLPDYMIPFAFVWLEALPLTPNGKVDRKALPAPDAAQMMGSTFAPPQTPMEEVLAALWAEVLGLPQVGRTDNFFEIGGHSLLATQVVARLRSAFAVELPVRTLFEAPTIAALGLVIEQRRQHGGDILPPLVVSERPAQLPLSYAQQRLWFLDQWEGPSATYNIPFAVRLQGELDVTALQAALKAIIQRHEALRTTFPASAGVAQQKIVPALDLALPIVDLQGVSEQTAALQQQLQEAAWKPFDLATGPLLRATLYRLHATEHVLLLTLHHIVTDGWSLGVLLKELQRFYQAQRTGEAPGLTPLPLQYADFTLWQHKWLQGSRLEQQRTYWRQQLAHAPTLLTLPTDYSRPPVQTFHGGMVEFKLDTELTAALRRLSQQQGVSLFMTLYASFAVLLARYSGQEDLIIGTPIANRQQRELEPLIGFFVNTLPLRADLTGNPSFAELLTRVRQLTLDAYAHQDIPFEQLVSDLPVARSLSHAPLFQVMLTLNNTHTNPPQLAELTVTPITLESVVAKFDLTLHVTEQAGALRTGWEYNRDLFAQPTVERMMNNFQVLLQAIVGDPSQAIQQLPLLSEAERHQLLVEWNNTATAYPTDKCIHQLIEEQVERTPDAVAVIYACGATIAENSARTPTIQNPKSKIQNPLTYRELNERANQLAHYLQTQGVGPGTLVGLCVERSLAMVVGILGILKAGGAYVPLDPTYPQERLAFVLADTAMRIVLSQQALQDRFSANQVQCLCLDTSWSPITAAGAATQNPQVALRPTDLAYIIYTSGSTGHPKGVMVNHTNLVHSTTARFPAYAQPVERFLLLSSFAFDSSVAGIFWSLCQGGALVLPPQDEEKDVLALASLISQYQITHLLCLPSLYRLLLTYATPAQLTSLQVAIVAGEACPPTLPSQHTQCVPGATLYNEYGPTEGTVWSTVYPLPAHWQGTQVPIGRPIANMQLYLLDRYGKPVPIGVPGELYIGGAGITPGYLNRPELTAEKFVDFGFEISDFGLGERSESTLPKSKIQNLKLYKTGDLARYLPDGNVEFLGRIDQQVKVRGFRIELGEIETVLARHPQVQEAVVVTRPGANGQQRLVAYVVQKTENSGQKPEIRDQRRETYVNGHQSPITNYQLPITNLQASDLRAFLQGKLPDYMLPAAFVSLKALPLTPNGKVDRKALPEPERTQADLAVTYVAPRDTFETMLAGIWQMLLDGAHVGVHDNFFELGGHSLLMAQLAAQIQATFQVRLSLRTLFQAPTLEAMSVAILEELLKQTDGDTLHTILQEL